MAKSRRVFEVAKELGVQSKDIVSKCVAEGVPGVTNHMSVVKIGLEQTIREWFSEDHSVATAVETAEQVDLAKARKKAARRSTTTTSSDSSSSNDGGGDATATAVEESDGAADASSDAAAAADEGADDHEVTASVDVAEPQVAEPVAEEPAQTPTPDATPQPVAEVPAPAAPKAAAPKVEPAPSEPVTTGKAHAKKEVPPPVEPAVGSVSAVGQVNVPRRPDNVKPAGEQLRKPTGAVLRGPKVVRIEKADPIAPPRPRRPAGGPGGPNQGGQGGGGGNNSGGPLAPGSVAGISRSRGPARGKGAGGAGAPQFDNDAPAGGKQAGNRRRSQSNRRGRSADALPTGPTKFSAADLAELDARLNQATGYVKRRRQDMKKREGGQQALTPAVTGGKVLVSEPITIKSLSSETGIKAVAIIKYLFKKGVMATINSSIDAEAAMEVALEYDIELEVKEQQSAEQMIQQEFDATEAVDVRPRPPVVTVLGHVDHGKTSLLDRIRKADVASHEDGGITQHVGAYRVTVDGSDGSEKTVVFLDTPGHEAFTTMRARGARLTDVAVVVVAADDGVMPQTIESINHAKAAEVPIVIALNKIDKREATVENIQKIYGQLAEHGLNPTEWGGETEVVRVSALNGTGVTDLLEVLDYQAALLELTADYGGRARGTLIEAEMQPGRGPVARVLVEQGTIRVGDFIVMGRAYGRVRDMTDDRGRRVIDAGPATPLEISGIDIVPDAGDMFYVTDTLQKAENVAMTYRETERNRQLAQQTKVTLANFADKLAEGQTKDLRVVLKADVQGSVETIKKALEQLGNKEVGVRVLHAGVGGVTESDVLLADASDAIVVGFHVVATPAVREIAEQRHVDLRQYRVIYELTDEVTKALEGMLTPETKEEEIGRAEVREVFRITKLGSIAGCLVTDGVIQRDGKIRLIRDGSIVTEGRQMESLRRVKDDAREVRAGTECGIRIAGFDDLKPNDVIVCYRVLSIARKLE